MQKYIFSIIVMMLSLMSANAQTVNITDVTLNPGETKVISVNLINTQTNIVSFQMDLSLPDGITINKVGCELGSRIMDEDQELVIGKQPDGSIRLTSTSFALTPIAGTSGEIIKLSLTASNDSKGGTASLKNVIIATSSSQKLHPSNISFKVNVPYTLTYKVDGEVYKTASINYGTAITPEVAPTKEGHTFSGWSEIPATMPAQNVVITGTFTVNNYTLTYKVDGEVYKTSTVAYETALTPEATPTKEGYTFSGWSEIPATMPANDVEITGTFSVNSYTLTYKVDGEIYKTSSVVYGTALTPEAAPTKEGHTFSGWSEIPATMPANDVVITGTFSINQYTMTFVLDNGQQNVVEKQDFGTALIAPENPVKTGFTFKGWSPAVPATVPATDMTFTAQFSVNSYTLTYKVDGEVYKTSTIAYGTALTPEIAPTKEGHTFSGWSEIPATMPANDVVVTGTFSVNSYTLTYKVDGEIYKTSSVVYGTALTPEAVPTKEGHTFSGWSEIPATMPAHDVVVTGSFSVNSYFLFYVLDGGIYKALSVKYGTSIVAESVPEKEGHAFSGWLDLPETMPAHDVTVQGKYIVNKYSLTYKVDGEVYKTTTIAYGTAITPETAPTKDGYTFSGWSEIPATMPANDVVITGSFSVNSYTLTYKVDGEIYKTIDVKYGETITPEPAPIKEGYTFSGWSEIPETMPAKDVTVTGTFTLDTGIGQIMGNENEKTIIFTIDGKRVDNMKKGMNVIRMKDGTIRKVIVK